MINSLIETENASRYHAIYISQLFVSDKKLVPCSKITSIIRKHITELLKKKEWVNISETLRKELSNRNNDSNKLNEYVLYFKDSSKINTWDDVIGLYCLITIVSQLCSEFDCKSSFVTKCTDLSIERHIINWIIKHGGWEAYEKAFDDKFKSERKENSKSNILDNKNTIMIGGALLGGLSILGALTYFYKKD